MSLVVALILTIDWPIQSEFAFVDRDHPKEEARVAPTHLTIQ